MHAGSRDEFQNSCRLGVDKTKYLVYTGYIGQDKPLANRRWMMSNLQPMIDNMNGAAAMMVANGHTVEDALERIASEYGLEFVAESDDGQCRVYEYMDELINCWMEGVMIDGIGDGGCGFDTQTDWYED